MHSLKMTPYIRTGGKSPILLMVYVLLLGLLIVWLSYWTPNSDTWSAFTTVFLGIFIEAVPFLMFGTLASGLVEVFLDQEMLQRIIPKSPLLGALMGGGMGLFFPVCECGVVPLVRRLYKKGLPAPVGISFLLAAPVINPIVLFSTATAFGFGRMLFLRVGFTFLIAVVTGLVFSAGTTKSDIMKEVPRESVETSAPECCIIDHHAQAVPSDLRSKIRRVFLVALDEFFEMGRYLILGALIAAGLQTFIPQSILLELGKGPVISVLVMVGLAVLLSICSTVDSFVALGFTGIFSTGSVLGFLLFGPMVDIKSILMFTRVFRPRAVIYMVLLPLMMTLLICISLNYFMVW